MFGLGTTELVVVMMIALLLFGSRLPSVMRNVGEAFRELRRGLRESDDDRLVE